MSEVRKINREMLKSFSQTNNWLITYQEMLSSRDWDDYFSFSASSLFPEIFIYYLVKNKAEIEQFNEVIQYCYKNFNNNKIENILQSYFYDRDVYYNSEEYKDIVANDSGGIMLKMSYLFVEWKEKFSRKEDAKHIQLNNDNLPYLMSLINSIPSKKADILSNACFYYFLAEFKENIEAIDPLIQMAKVTSVLNKRKQKSHYSFFDNLIQLVSENTEPIQRKKDYEYLKITIPNLLELSVQALTSISSEDINGNVLRFMLSNEDSLAFIKLLNEDYQKNIKDTEEFSRILNRYNSTLGVYCEGINFDFNIDLIDLNKSADQNSLILSLLNLKRKQGSIISTSKELIDYLKNIIEIEKEKKKDYFNNKDYPYVSEKVDMKEVIDYLSKIEQYQQMETNLAINETANKPKI